MTLDSNKQEDRTTARRQLARNTIFSGLTSLSDGFLLLLFIVAGRFLGAEGFGIFSLATAITSTLVFATDLGLDSLATRQIAVSRKRAAQVIGALLVWKLLLSLILLAIFYSAIFFYFDNSSTRVLISILAPASLLRSLNVSFRAYLQGFEKFSLETFIVLSDRLLLLAFGITVLLLTRDPVMLAWVFLVTRGITFIFFVALTYKKVCKFVPIVDVSFIKAFQLEALPLGISSIVYGLYLQVDILMLGIFVSVSEVGLFNSAMKIYESVLMVPLIINPVVYPRLSYLHMYDPGRYKDLLFRAFKYLLIFAFLFAMLGSMFSDKIIELLFGSNFLDASMPITILLIAAGFQFVVLFVHTAFRSLGLQKLVLRITIIGLLVKVAANPILIPLAGINGASLAVCSSTIIMATISLIALRKHGIVLSALAWPTLKITIAAGLATLGCLVTPSDAFTVQVMSLVVLYVVCLIWLRIFDKFELDLIRGFLRA